MSKASLELDVRMLNRARAELYAELTGKHNKSLAEVFDDLQTLRGITKLLREKEALLESMRPLAEWERELLGI